MNAYNKIKKLHENSLRNKTFKQIDDELMDKLDDEIMEIVRHDFLFKYVYLMGMHEQVKITQRKLDTEIQIASKNIKDNIKMEQANES